MTEVIRGGLLAHRAGHFALSHYSNIELGRCDRYYSSPAPGCPALDQNKSDTGVSR